MSNNKSNNNNSKNAETIEPYISEMVPTCKTGDNLGYIAGLVFEEDWDDMNHVFVLNEDGKLEGVIDLAGSALTDSRTLAEKFMKPCSVRIKSGDNRQKAVVAAVKNDLDIVPVVDGNEKFLGAVISKTLIELMHTEHLEQVLLTSGIAIKKSKISDVLSAGLFQVVKYRIPWLILGLIAGLGLGLISSIFEDHLQNNIAIAYFIPVIAYIADSVGTQSEAIAVRSLATLKVNTTYYLIREFLVGVMVGAIVGVLGSVGAFLISGQFYIGVVVGLTLFSASAIAAVLASSIPVIFKLMGKDPALGSGPLATAIQDTISVILYFLFVVWFL